MRRHSWSFYNPGRSAHMDGWMCGACGTSVVGESPPSSDGLEAVGIAADCDAASEMNKTVDDEIAVSAVLFD